ncbi:hypothetical protein Glove_42g54 [Diversispora epigaea]|uniref:Uncharacterized protein n=1 Tax=Diversispora epigaea TaxID=1348612 RepID=A0A397JFW3_9GLOM|nr:hypothetical protein Glove_42g54 [Diversispora epigaea]
MSYELSHKTRDKLFSIRNSLIHYKRTFAVLQETIKNRENNLIRIIIVVLEGDDDDESDDLVPQFNPVECLEKLNLEFEHLKEIPLKSLLHNWLIFGINVWFPNMNVMNFSSLHKIYKLLS